MYVHMAAGDMCANHLDLFHVSKIGHFHKGPMRPHCLRNPCEKGREAAGPLIRRWVEGKFIKRPKSEIQKKTFKPCDLSCGKPNCINRSWWHAKNSWPMVIQTILKLVVCDWVLVHWKVSKWPADFGNGSKPQIIAVNQGAPWEPWLQPPTCAGDNMSGSVWQVFLSSQTERRDLTFNSKPLSFFTRFCKRNASITDLPVLYLYLGWGCCQAQPVPLPFRNGNWSRVLVVRCCSHFWHQPPTYTSSWSILGESSDIRVVGASSCSLNASDNDDDVTGKNVIRIPSAHVGSDA